MLWTDDNCHVVYSLSLSGCWDVKCLEWFLVQRLTCTPPSILPSHLKPTWYRMAGRRQDNKKEEIQKKQKNNRRQETILQQRTAHLLHPSHKDKCF